MWKSCCVFLVLGILMTLFCRGMESNFLSEFLRSHIISLTITLIAITSAVRAIILSKLTEISASNKDIDFTATFKELKISIYEQVGMILIAVFTLIIGEGMLMKRITSVDVSFITDAILTGVLFYSIYILYDTAISVIDIFIAQNKN